jgi:hypothetical protein
MSLVGASNSEPASKGQMGVSAIVAVRTMTGESQRLSLIGTLGLIGNLVFSFMFYTSQPLKLKGISWRCINHVPNLSNDFNGLVVWPNIQASHTSGFQPTQNFPNGMTKQIHTTYGISFGISALLQRPTI